jgi:ferredoxin
MLGIFLFYTTINCIDAVDMIERLEAHKSMNDAVKVELVEVIQEATPHCPWDAND